MVAAAPWAFGAVDPFFENILLLGIAGLALCWGARACCLGNFLWFTCPVSLSIALIFVLGVVQIVPIPGWVLAVASPAAKGLNDRLRPTQPETVSVEVEASTSTAPSTISLNPAATRTSLMQFLAVLILFAAVRNNVACSGALRRLAWLCLVNGCALSVFALYQFFGSPHKSVYGYPTNGEVFGPFICRNHFAFYMNLCIGLAVGLLLISGKTENDKRARRTYKANAQVEQNAEDDTTLSLLSFLHSPLQLWLSAGLALMVSSVVVSMSRGGVVALVVGAIVTVALRGFTGKRVTRIDLMLVPVLLVGGLIAWLGISPLESRLATLWKGGLTGDGRMQIWQNVLPIAARFPVFGSGYGTLPVVEPLYRQSDYGGYNADVVIDHAHNDYLESLVEGGIPRLLATIAIVFFLLRYGRKAMRRHEVRTPGRLALGALIGITAVAVHSLIDFGMFTPAVTCLATVTAAYLATMARNDPSTPPTSESKHALILPGEMLGAAGAAVTLAILGVILVRSGGATVVQQRLRIRADAVLHKFDPPNVEQAIVFISDAVKRQPSEPSLRVELGQLYLDAARWNGGTTESDRYTALGLQQMVAARDLCPLLGRPQARLAAHAFDVRGSGFKMAKSDSEAAYWARALELAPYDAELLYFSGVQHFAAGRFDAAWAAWRGALERRPAHIREIVTSALPKLGAESLIRDLLPPSPDHLVEAAKCATDLPGQEAAQKALLLKAREMLMSQTTERSPDGIRLLAVVHRMLGETSQAKSGYQEALLLSPGSHSWRFEYAELLHSLGSRPELLEASRQVDAILRDMPNHGPANNLKSTLDRELKPPTNRVDP